MTTTTDSYLSNISNESLEVLHHFGPEAPLQLNTYARSLEDALQETLQQQTLLRRQVQRLQSERRELQDTLSDPDRLCHPLLLSPRALPRRGCDQPLRNP